MGRSKERFSTRISRDSATLLMSKFQPSDPTLRLLALELQEYISVVLCCSEPILTKVAVIYYSSHGKLVRHLSVRTLHSQRKPSRDRTPLLKFWSPTPLVAGRQLLLYVSQWFYSKINPLIALSWQGSVVPLASHQIKLHAGEAGHLVPLGTTP